MYCRHYLHAWEASAPTYLPNVRFHRVTPKHRILTEEGRSWCWQRDGVAVCKFVLPDSESAALGFCVTYILWTCGWTLNQVDLPNFCTTLPTSSWFFLKKKHHVSRHWFRAAASRGSLEAQARVRGPGAVSKHVWSRWFSREKLGTRWESTWDIFPNIYHGIYMGSFFWII